MTFAVPHGIPSQRARVLALFLVVFAVLGTASLTLVHVAARHDRQNEILRVKAQSSQRVVLARELASAAYQVILPDLWVLGAQNELRELVRQRTPGNRRRVLEEFVAFCRYKGYYQQVRYLDSAGMEVCRVDLRDGVPVAVPADQLQDKSGTPYFRAAVSLLPGQCYMSLLDLNVERGVVEVPYRPVIRFCLPIFDARGTRQGIVVLNYRAQRLLDLTCDAASTPLADVLLVDSRGYYLVGMRPEDEWGFMLPGRQDRRMGVDFPEPWHRMQAGESGQFLHDGALFTYARTNPVPDNVVVGRSYRLDLSGLDEPTTAGHGRPILVSYTPQERLLSRAGQIVRHEGAIEAGVALVAAVLSFVLARGSARRRAIRDMIVRLATYDELTGLPNRTLFLDRVQQARKRAMRYKRPFALLFMDLNGFKGVNDSLGHQAGDDLLRQVAARCVERIRAADTFARLGGDEFVLIAEGVGSREAAEAIGRKIIDAFADPFQLSSRAIHIGASVGIALFDGASDEDEDELIRRADTAMYRAKGEGGSLCRHYDPELDAAPELVS